MIVASSACQADINPFEGDLFIHYKQLNPGEMRMAEGPQEHAGRDAGRASRPDASLPAATTRPPSLYQGVRVGQVEGRELSSFEGPPTSVSRRKLGDLEPPAPLPDDLKSCIKITTTLGNSHTSAGQGGDLGAQHQEHAETVHHFSHTGVRMLEAALRPGAWYTNSRTQPGTMAAFKRANYWSKGTPPI